MRGELIVCLTAGKILCLACDIAAAAVCTCCLAAELLFCKLPVLVIVLLRVPADVNCKLLLEVKLLVVCVVVMVGRPPEHNVSGLITGSGAVLKVSWESSPLLSSTFTDTFGQINLKM